MKTKKKKKLYKRIVKTLVGAQLLLQSLNSRLEIMNQILLSLHVATTKVKPYKLYTTPKKQRKLVPPEGVYADTEEEE